MQAEQIKCPCCGQTMPTTDEVQVSLTENRLVYNQHSIHLQKRLASLAYVLARRMPETVAHEVIVQQMWGQCEGDFAFNNVKVAVSQLRPRLQAIGLDIETNWGIGYSMVVAASAMSRTERTSFSTVTGEDYAQA